MKRDTESLVLETPDRLRDPFATFREESLLNSQCKFVLVPRKSRDVESNASSTLLKRHWSPLGKRYTLGTPQG